MMKTPRNVILLSFDALRANHLGCYGYERDTSPNLDRFAEENLQFLNAYSASSHTREAVPALLTGEYPDLAVDSNYHLATDTIASMLSEAGFATAGFHSNPFVSRAYGFDRGFDRFDDDLHFGNNKLVALAQRALDKLRNRHYARAEEINDRSLSWVESIDDDQPFFLWNHYMDTHGPYEPPGDYRTLFRNNRVSNRKAQSLYRRAIKEPDSITESERRLLIDLYDAEIRYNDRHIGEFLERLEQHQLRKDSLIIITADHGDAFGEHGYYEHPRYLHEEITKIPFLIEGDEFTSGEISVPVSTLDISETISSLFGIQTGSEGCNLLDLDDDRRVFSQARGEGDHEGIRRYALRTTDEHCFCERDSESGSIEFTDCQSRSLREELREHVTQRRSKQTRESTADSEVQNEEIDRRLDALGYK